MQLRSILIGTTLAALVPLANATPPQALTALELGATQAVLDFCAKVDDGEKKDFDELGRRELARLSPQKAGEFKNSAQYQQGYTALQNVLARFSPDNARAACRAVPPEARGKTGDGEKASNGRDK